MGSMNHEVLKSFIFQVSCRETHGKIYKWGSQFNLLTNNGPHGSWWNNTLGVWPHYPKHGNHDSMHGISDDLFSKFYNKIGLKFSWVSMINIVYAMFLFSAFMKKWLKCFN
jgi:hypothetical protein